MVRYSVDMNDREAKGLGAKGKNNKIFILCELIISKAEEYHLALPSWVFVRVR